MQGIAVSVDDAGIGLAKEEALDEGYPVVLPSHLDGGAEETGLDLGVRVQQVGELVAVRDGPTQGHVVAGREAEVPASGDENRGQPAPGLRAVAREQLPLHQIAASRLRKRCRRG